jgi:hypothetical protein
MAFVRFGSFVAFVVGYNLRRNCEALRLSRS